MTMRGNSLSSILTLGAGALAALYLISAPLAMLLVAAFRGPDDMLPFEQGAVWTLDNLVAVYGDRALYTNVIPNTLIFTAGAVALGFVTAFILAWLTERCDLPFRNAIFALILFPLLVPGVVLAIAWIFLLGAQCRLGQHGAARRLRAQRRGADQHLLAARHDRRASGVAGAVHLSAADAPCSAR